MRSRDTSLDPLRMYYLQAGSSANNSNEILTTLRLMLDPTCKMYLAQEQNAVLLRCTPQQIEIADQIMRQINTARSNYRLTYSIAESDGGKRIGLQHFSLLMIPGARTTLKNGSKVPVATGSYSAGNATSQVQFTYLDVGLNFDVTLSPGADGLRLQSKIEQSATTEDRTISGVNEPVVRQTVLEGSVTLVLGKPLAIGSLDIAGSTRHLDVEVLLEPVK